MGADLSDLKTGNYMSQVKRKDDLQKIADHEYRKLGNLGELLMEWSFEQLKAAGSTERLLKYKIRSTSPNRHTDTEAVRG